MKITARAKEDFDFFSSTSLDMIGRSVGVEFPVDGSGLSALECWFHKDAHGINMPCREPELLTKALRGKKSWNLQIKLWAEDVADGMLLGQDELVSYCRGLPSWILDATMNQAAKICIKTVGYVPRFARLETVHGQWWPPYMDSFDPLI